jgi:hypothetical protein
MRDGELEIAIAREVDNWRELGGDKSNLVGAIERAVLRHPELKCSAALVCIIADELILKGWVKTLKKSRSEYPIKPPEGGDT